MDLSRLNSIRKAVRASYTKCSEDIKLSLKDDSMTENYDALLQQLSDKFTRLEAIQKDISEKLLQNGDNEAEYMKNYEMAETYRHDYTVVCYHLRNKIQSTLTTNSVPVLEDKILKISKLELGKFSGDPREYLAFWSQFSKIDSDPDIMDDEKFHYLLKAVVPNSKAAKLMRSFSPTKDNYRKAIDQLKERFGRDNLLVQVNVRDLLDMVVKNATSGKKNPDLAELYASIESKLLALESIGKTKEHFADFLEPLVEFCLPADLRCTWEKNHNRSDPSEDHSVRSLDNLMLFLRNEMKAEEMITRAPSGFGSSSKDDSKSIGQSTPPPPTTEALINSSKSPSLSSRFYPLPHGMSSYNAMAPQMPQQPPQQQPPVAVQQQQQQQHRSKALPIIDPNTGKNILDSSNDENTSYPPLEKVPDKEKMKSSVQDVLNKLTTQSFETVLIQLKKFNFDTEEKLNDLVHLIYEKAIDEPNFSVSYANLCKHLATIKVPLAGQTAKFVNFRKLLLTKCQNKFEQGGCDEKYREEKLKTIEKAEGENKKLLQIEFEKEEKMIKYRQFGNIRFIGELFKLNMLIEPIIHECIKKLLSQGDEECLECLCILLKTIGKELEEGKTTKNSSENLGTTKLGEVWRESGLQWSDFLGNDSNVTEFIQKHKLDFTVCPMKIKVETQMSLEVIQASLLNLLKKTDESDEIVEWIDANVTEKTEPNFIRALVTTVHRDVIHASGAAFKLDTTKLKKRTTLLTRYIDHDETLELQALYALQALMHQLGHPSGVLHQIFDILYDDDVITEDAFKQWEQSDDPNEVEGKGLAVHSSKIFFTWLRESESGDDDANE